jgi:hypothetical protein
MNVRSSATSMIFRGEVRSLWAAKMTTSQEILFDRYSAAPGMEIMFFVELVLPEAE